MYIEYVTVDERKVLHQFREVATMASAVKRLQATGFELMHKATFGNIDWTNGKTRAYIRFGSLADVRKAIIRDTHEYSFLD